MCNPIEWRNTCESNNNKNLDFSEVIYKCTREWTQFSSSQGEKSDKSICQSKNISSWKVECQESTKECTQQVFEFNEESCA